MNIRFTGINIHSKEPEKAFEFYKGLGLAVKSEGAPGDKWYGAEFDLGGSTLWIWRDNDGCAKSGGGMVIVLACGDMDADYAELSAKGYAVTAPERMFYGGREMRLADIDGNEILFLD